MGSPWSQSVSCISVQNETPFLITVGDPILKIVVVTKEGIDDYILMGRSSLLTWVFVLPVDLLFDYFIRGKR